MKPDHEGLPCLTTRTMRVSTKDSGIFSSYTLFIDKIYKKCPDISHVKKYILYQKSISWQLYGQKIGYKKSFRVSNTIKYM
jgi:hypothetical protein